MTNALLACVAVGLVIVRAAYGSKDGGLSVCRHDEYPRSIQVGEYGEIRFQCEKLQCGYLQPKCNQIFFELSCKERQWVGGVAGSSNLNNLVPLQCCDVPEVNKGRKLGVTVVHANERYSGEQLRDNRNELVSYDVITNIQKVTMQPNQYALEVSTVRMTCKGKGPSLDTAQRGQGFGLGGGGGQFNSDGILNQYDNQPLNNLDTGFEDVGFDPLPLEPEPLLPPADTGFAPPLPPQALGPAPGVFGPPGGFFGGGGGGGGAACFTGDTTVETPSGPKTMEQLKIGDNVLTLEDGIQKFTPVTSFIHRLPEKHVKFQQIQAVDGTSLKLTPQHFLYIADCKDSAKAPALKFARDVKPGECWVKVDSELHNLKRVRISGNSVVHQTGAYAPLTDNGIIVTDGIMASCHSVYKNEEFMDSFVHYADQLKGLFNGLFSAVGLEMPEGATVELPWLIKYGQAHLEKLILQTK